MDTNMRVGKLWDGFKDEILGLQIYIMFEIATRTVSDFRLTAISINKHSS